MAQLSNGSKYISCHTQDREDELQWIHSPFGEYMGKMGYIFIITCKGPMKYAWWWKLKCLAKSQLFQWCPLCKVTDETMDPLFMSYSFTCQIWNSVRNVLSMDFQWQGSSYKDAWKTWWNFISPKKLRNLPPIIS